MNNWNCKYLFTSWFVNDWIYCWVMAFIWNSIIYVGDWFSVVNHEICWQKHDEPPWLIDCISLCRVIVFCCVSKQFNITKCSFYKIRMIHRDYDKHIVILNMPYIILIMCLLWNGLLHNYNIPYVMYLLKNSFTS
jgi:hypothetical protein